MTTFFINILAFGTLLSSVFTITSKNPVISVIFLIATFVQAAVFLILIGINFIGLAYIVIYVGAIAVLFLFVIMMINIKLTDILETGNQYTKNLPLAISIASLFIFIIFSVLPFNFNNVPALSIFLENLTILNNITSNPIFELTEIINKVDTSISFLSSSDVLISDFQQIQVLGLNLYTYGSSLLIILSIILLLSMLAILILTRGNSAKSNLKDNKLC
jgi:NADH-ubiquinone oxidoreductase chain 6